MAENQTPPVGPGPELQRAREARGMSVHQLAVELHVSDAMINAMERGDYAMLGEPVFVRGHLRNYARALGIPEAEVLSAYDLAQHKPATPLLQPVPHTGGGMSPRTREWSTRAATGAVVVVLLMLLAAWWMRRPAEPVIQPLSMVPAAATAPAPSTQPMAALTDLADGAQPAAVQKPAAKPATPPAATRAPALAARTKPVTPAPRPATVPQQVSAAVDERDLVHATFVLGAASWVEVYDNNGKRIYYDLAPAGDNLKLTGAGPLQVFLGNAPGVSVELEGASFDIKPFLRSDNTARFKLGSAAKQ
ncbi:MAG TPA: RodZ domain-containing protein [Gammaproteobacteria bacterium]|nr:RodZ domain-containing protein [Gammaproteobacteria bacterium]